MGYIDDGECGYDGPGFRKAYVAAAVYGEDHSVKLERATATAVVLPQMNTRARPREFGEERSEGWKNCVRVRKKAGA